MPNTLTEWAETESDRLPPPNRIAPIKAVPVDEVGDNWTIAYQTGASGDGKDWAIATDNVRASALCFDLEFPGDAGSDAKA